MKAKVNWKNIKAYVQGNIREWLFYSPRLNFLLPLHIFEQINYRLFVMNKECYYNGECIECGCATPALQMANKTCGGKCYPIMVNATDWHIYKREYNIEFKYWNSTKSREFELRITHKTSNV
jgi:hypothetical protein